uniref:Cysteine-rich transmembrane CYSTM domain-containing protein n=1 Tax=Parascaris univalens TaxID=6257 RepID=A0A914ZMU3_PARUN
MSYYPQTHNPQLPNSQGQYTVQQQPAPYPQGQLPPQSAYYPQGGYGYPQQGGYPYAPPPGYYQQPAPPPQETRRSLADEYSCCLMPLLALCCGWLIGDCFDTNCCCCFIPIPLPRFR